MRDDYCLLLDFARKVQKSLADLEKLHLSGQGINLFLPTGVGHKHEDKVGMFSNKWLNTILNC